MSKISIHCSECAWKMEIDKSEIGETLKCPKCKLTFIAEDDSLYGIVGDEKPEEEAEAEEDEWSTPTPVAPPKPSKQAKPSRPLSKEKPAKAAESEPMSDDKWGDLMSSMDKWAEE